MLHFIFNINIYKSVFAHISNLLLIYLSLKHMILAKIQSISYRTFGHINYIWDINIIRLDKFAWNQFKKWKTVLNIRNIRNTGYPVSLVTFRKLIKKITNCGIGMLFSLLNLRKSRSFWWKRSGKFFPRYVAQLNSTLWKT